VFAGVIFVIPVAAAESSDIDVIIDGVELELDVPPQIIDDRTMVPMRGIFEALGADVYWEDYGQIITVTLDETIILKQIGNRNMHLDGVVIAMDAPPTLIDGTTFVSVWAVVASFGMDLDWDSDGQTITFSSLLPEATPVVALFSASRHSFGMFVVINNAEWGFAIYDNFNVVIFQNLVQPTDGNHIALFAFPLEGDFEQEVVRFWDESLANHADAFAAVDFVYQDRQAIMVGAGQYPGYLFAFESTYNNVTRIENTLFWSVGGLMYVCNTYASQEGAAEVQAVLDGLLESFVPLGSPLQ